MKRTLLIATITLAATAAIASAAGPNVAWSKDDMKAAIRAIGYPRAHPLTLYCQGFEPSADRYASFRCKETYASYPARVFYIQGQGLGGWLCAGSTLDGCKLLGHGFIAADAVSAQGLPGAVSEASKGWMSDHYFPYQIKGACKRTAALTWSCPFVGHTVTLTLRKVSTGYVSSATG